MVPGRRVQLPWTNVCTLCLSLHSVFVALSKQLTAVLAAYGAPPRYLYFNLPIRVTFAGSVDYGVGEILFDAPLGMVVLNPSTTASSVDCPALPAKALLAHPQYRTLANDCLVRETAVALHRKFSGIGMRTPSPEDSLPLRSSSFTSDTCSHAIIQPEHIPLRDGSQKFSSCTGADRLIDDASTGRLSNIAYSHSLYHAA
jgi:hypothetical protein